MTSKEKLLQLRHDFYNNEELNYDSIAYFTAIEKDLEILKQYKNIEEELGIDLITIFKALKNGFYYKDDDYGILTTKFWTVGIDTEYIFEAKDKLQKDYETLFKAKQETEKRLTETNKMFKDARELLTEYLDKYFGLLFYKIVHNKEKGTTVVWFEKDNKIIVKRRKGAKDDVYTAVAYAIAEKLYGSNTRFKKVVDEDVKIR